MNDVSDQGSDPLLADAVAVIAEYDRATASLLQRRLNLSYERASSLIDELEARGYVGPFDGSNARQVLHKEANVTPGARAAARGSSRTPAEAVKTNNGPHRLFSSWKFATATAVVVVTGLWISGLSAGGGTTPTPTTRSTAAPLDVLPASPSARLTEAESSLLAGMTARYDACRQGQPPRGTVEAEIRCMTDDGVSVHASQYTSAAALADAFTARGLAEKGTRCSAGAYLGDYKVAGEPTGQLACSGAAGVIAWTVPTLRLYLSASDLSMPELYAWWKYHWTVGSVASGATTGEKAVPIPVAAADTPEPNDTVDESEAPAGGTWSTEFAENLCIAIAEHSIFVDDLINLEAAAAANDLNALSLHAYALGADVLTIDTALEFAPTYEPATAMIAAWREALAAYAPAFEDIDAGASQGNQSLLDRGLRRLNEASALLEIAIPMVEEFRSDTGFTC